MGDYIDYITSRACWLRSEEGSSFPGSESFESSRNKIEYINKGKPFNIPTLDASTRKPWKNRIDDDVPIPYVSKHFSSHRTKGTCEIMPLESNVPFDQSWTCFHSFRHWRRSRDACCVMQWNRCSCVGPQPAYQHHYAYHWSSKTSDAFETSFARLCSFTMFKNPLEMLATDHCLKKFWIEAKDQFTCNRLYRLLLVELPAACLCSALIAERFVVPYVVENISRIRWQQQTPWKWHPAKWNGKINRWGIT